MNPIKRIFKSKERERIDREQRDRIKFADSLDDPFWSAWVRGETKKRDSD